MMLVIFEFFDQIESTELAKALTVLLRQLMSDMSFVLMFLRAAVSFLMNIISSLLSLTIVLFLVLMCSSMMEIAVIREVWSDVSLHSG